LTKQGEIADPYRSFIAKSRYSKWIESEGRRETWTETVDRYIDGMKRKVASQNVEVPEKTWNKARKAILNHEVMPSMRGLMTAGPALDRSELAIFNCSFLAFNAPEAFSELLYILMHGVGAGFSVESEEVNQLPIVPEKFTRSGDAIVVEDSKEGWARAYKRLVACLYDGKIPAFDITAVRPSGARLKTFGGRASGPQPLIDLFDFTIEHFEGAAGRRLTPLEVHDIACKIGDVVVVGGVRRSALISLSDLESYEMAKAKSGAWWETEPQRRLSNNSAVYTKKPSIGEFLQEWGHLYESRSGERGIYNRQLAQSSKYAPRRDGSRVTGTNPCGEINLRDMGLCNLTEVIVSVDDDLESLLDKVEIATFLGTIQSMFVEFDFLRPEWSENAKEERLLGVSLTGQFGNELLSGKLGKRALKHTLTEMKRHAISINKKYAKTFGINQSAAITTVKPSGTVSQLTYSSAGMHAWHSEYYLRNVRADIKDPLNAYMTDLGIPSEPDVMKPDSTTVFTFPIKAPEGAITRNDLSAVEHLDIWLMYKKYWTEHNPSITVSVREDEWISVANWVYANWEDVGGLSFLPYDGGSYRQAPYQDCDEATYKQFLADMPKSIDWSMLSAYESEDNTVGTQTLSCTSASCELVDLTA
jgi:ribonucleoside-diphosphate reductase alpha chain